MLIRDLSMPYLNIDAKHLDYAWFGPPPQNTTTLVLLHEGLGSVALWRDFPQRLAATTGLPVFVYSRLGFGQSDSGPSRVAVNYMHDHALDELPKILHAMDIERHALIGHSDGGSIAIIYAGSERADQRLAGLVLVAPHVFVEPVSVASIAATAEEYKRGDLRQKMQRYHGQNTDPLFAAWSGIWLSEDFLQWNIEEFLPNISVPVLTVQGEDDQYGTHRQVDSIRSSVSGKVDTLFIPDCKHSPQREQPAILLAATANFIQAL